MAVQAHPLALKWILHCLKRSLGRVLVFHGSARDGPVECYVDLDYFRCLDT